MTPKSDNISWWVGLGREQFADVCKQKQAELAASAEGQRNPDNRMNKAGRPGGVPSAKG